MLGAELLFPVRFHSFTSHLSFSFYDFTSPLLSTDVFLQFEFLIYFSVLIPVHNCFFLYTWNLF